jgi:thioredoxin reductase (NADPH)
MDESRARYDVIIVGGGLAGLSAAFWLARYRRRVRVHDAGGGRNQFTWVVHGYPGLPDLTPAELRRRLHEQATAAGAEHVQVPVQSIEREGDVFRVIPVTGPPVLARRVLLAFGRRDVLPEIPGIAEAYGTSVFHCPDCDGPSLTGARVGVLGWTAGAAELALYLLTWVRDTVLLTHGHDLELDEHGQATLRRYGIRIRTEPIARLAHRNGRITRIEFGDGSALPLDAVFCHLRSLPATGLAEQLGCEADRDGCVRVDRGQQTSIPGIYAAGDLVGHPHLAIIAASSGVRAALAIHRSLLPPDHRLGAS